MSLLKDVGDPVQRSGPLCAVVRFTRDHPADADDFVTLLNDPLWLASVLSAQLFKARGVNVSADAIRRHRRGACGCRKV
jgi:hypothetical protein